MYLREFCLLQHVRNLDQMTVWIMSKSDVNIYVPPRTVCMECIVGGEVSNDTIFQINGTNIDDSTGRVVDGVLVVFDTESVFTTSSATDVQCMSLDLNASHSVGMYLESKSHYIHVTLQLYESLNSSLQASSNHWKHHPQQRRHTVLGL